MAGPRQAQTMDDLPAVLSDRITSSTTFVHIVPQFVVYAYVLEASLEPICVWGGDYAELLFVGARAVLQPVAPGAQFSEGIPQSTRCLNHFGDVATALRQQDATAATLEVRGVLFVDADHREAPVEVHVWRDGSFLTGIRDLLTRLVTASGPASDRTASAGTGRASP